MNSQKILGRIVQENEIDLKGTGIKAFSPFTKNIFSNKRKLAHSFREIEGIIKEKANPFYEDFSKFKEIGGFFLIRNITNFFYPGCIFETVGNEGTPSVKPGIGVDYRWSCEFPRISDLHCLDWESAVLLIKYHTHPFINSPHPKDIEIGIRELSEVPKGVRYLQTIYSKDWYSPFFWFEHLRKN